MNWKFAKTNKGLLARLALLSATLIWGCSFVIVKNTVDVFPPNILLGIRFSVAAVILALAFLPKLKLIDWGYIWQGSVLGALLFTSYWFQTVGITDTTPGKNAFLTATYCVIVPFLFWITDKKRPDRYNLIAAFLCLGGIGLVSLDSQLTVSFGDGMSLACGVFYAAHIIAVARFTQKRDVFLLTTIQFAFSGIVAGTIGLIFEPLPTQVDSGAIFGMVYLAVFATAVALLLQNVGQKYTEPSAASLILSLESVFGVICSLILYEGEQMNLPIGIGFLLIFIAIVISETKLSFLRKKQ
ncbi:MAG: DMT family transporter [Ruminococcaceae bacterium]|nr:DMT family transporter [Oscillospiraceae bacterium]